MTNRARGLVMVACVGAGCASRPVTAVAPSAPVAPVAQCVGEPVIPPSAPPRGPGLPVSDVVSNADPAVRARRVVMLPTRLRLRAVDGGVMASWDTEGLEPVSIDVGCHMVVGHEDALGVSAPGVETAWRVYGYAGGAEFSGAQGRSESRVDVPRDAAPGPRVVRARLVVFETDVPPQHEWTPTNGRYRVLHERTVDAPLP